MVSIEGGDECARAGLVCPLWYLVAVVVLGSGDRRSSNAHRGHHAGAHRAVFDLCRRRQGAAICAYRDGVAELARVKRAALRLSLVAGQGQGRQFGLDDL